MPGPPAFISPGVRGQRLSTDRRRREGKVCLHGSFCTVPRGSTTPGGALSNKWSGVDCVRLHLSLGTYNIYLFRQGPEEYTMLYREQEGRTGDPPVPGIPKTKVGLVKNQTELGREKSQPDSWLPPWDNKTLLRVVDIVGLYLA